MNKSPEKSINITNRINMTLDLNIDQLPQHFPRVQHHYTLPHRQNRQYHQQQEDQRQSQQLEEDQRQLQLTHINTSNNLAIKRTERVHSCESCHNSVSKNNISGISSGLSDLHRSRERNRYAHCLSSQKTLKRASINTNIPSILNKAITESEKKFENSYSVKYIGELEHGLGILSKRIPISRKRKTFAKIPQLNLSTKDNCNKDPNLSDNFNHNDKDQEIAQNLRDSTISSKPNRDNSPRIIGSTASDEQNLFNGFNNNNGQYTLEIEDIKTNNKKTNSNNRHENREFDNLTSAMSSSILVVHQINPKVPRSNNTPVDNPMLNTPIRKRKRREPYRPSNIRLLDPLAGLSARNRRCTQTEDSKEIERTVEDNPNPNSALKMTSLSKRDSSPSNSVSHFLRCLNTSNSKEKSPRPNPLDELSLRLNLRQVLESEIQSNSISSESSGMLLKQFMHNIRKKKRYDNGNSSSGSCGSSGHGGGGGITTSIKQEKGGDNNNNILPYINDSTRFNGVDRRILRFSELTLISSRKIRCKSNKARFFHADEHNFYGNI